MTKGQFDILLKHGDIIQNSCNGHFYFNAKKSIYLTRSERLATEDDIYFDLSERLYEILSKLFNWYAELEMDEFKESLDVRLAELPDKDVKVEYLKKKYLDNFNQFEQLIEANPFQGFSLQELKDCWFLLIENDHLLSLIEYLKFAVLNTKRIPGNFPGKNDFHLFENYFLSDNLQIAYKGMKLEKRINYLKRKIEDFDEPSMPKTDNDNEFLHSSIEDWLNDFKNNMTQIDYTNLTQAIKYYFLNGKFPTMDRKINIGKVNKKRLGWALNKIYGSQRSNALPMEYLRFAKDNISIFANVDFDEQNFRKSNLYKYFTTKQG
jgi:hypothetical protein